ncbi:MAG: tetratricopeptide repeat protein [Bdellovibrionaceae bacterium]|nr:tetratricopeptide repeat protein [Pseudobdellovibrionaceae bacterium]NUM57787.1 tetratricopeptide repeat protein [Pseudobdellovibrionaceae bacterium]
MQLLKSNYVQSQKFFYQLCLLTIFLVGCNGVFPDLRAIKANNLAAKKMKDQSLNETQNGFLEAMKWEPFQEEVHLNLGTTYEVLKDQEKALRLYQNVEKIYQEKKKIFSEYDWGILSPNHSLMLLFVSYFNQAQLLARENKIDEALEKYQLALSLNPDSKEVKTNIELLLQQQQNQQGQGEGDQKNQQQNKDQQAQNNSGKDGKDQNKDQDKDQGKDKKDKQYSSSPKYKPREFKGDLNKDSVNKIFSEISQQEKKMQTQFSKQNQSKESPNEKDW